MKRNNRQGQTVLQYAVLIILVAAAFMAMRSYLLGALQEKYRQSADVFGEGEQYQEGVTRAVYR